VREADGSGGPVYLTLAHLDESYVRRRFPTVGEMCSSVGLDLARDPVPVGPAAHYIMGGVDTDEWGRTSLEGLYAAGEVACTGVHGANRLASNSLLEGLVFGARAARAMQEPRRPAALKPDRIVATGSWHCVRQGPPSLDHDMTNTAMTADAIRDLMWKNAGLFRTRAGLETAVTWLERAPEPAFASGIEGYRLRNLLTVAALIARAALRREESRGGHFREDFPERNDRAWRIHIVEQSEGTERAIR